MRRRKFLQWSSIGALSPLLANSGPLDKPVREMDPRLAVAFWAPETPVNNPGRALRAFDPNPAADSLSLGPESGSFQPDLVPAVTLQADTELIGKNLRLSVLGFLPSLAVWEDQSAEFGLELPHPTNPNDQNNFNIWQFRLGKGLPNQAVGLHLLVEEAGVTLLTQFASNEKPVPLAFCFRGEEHLKLRAGVYLVALANRAGALPDWQDYQMRSANPENRGTRKYPFRLDGDQLVQADFPYMALIFSTT